MSSPPNTGLPPATDDPNGTPFIAALLGAAVFDLNGLPKEYFTAVDNSNMSWVQTIFQALGLRSLLMSALHLEGFCHATIYGETCCAVVVKQPNCYTAFLLQRQPNIPSDKLLHWVENFQISTLRHDSRFQAV